MKRYTLTPYEQACPGTREVYDEFLRLSGAAEPPVWMLSLGHNPTLIKAYWEKTRGCLLEGELPHVLKEMTVFVVSRVNGAEYCSACHAHSALQLDPTLSYHDLVTILDPDSAVPLPPSHRVALQFADKMARDANGVSDAEFQALADAGFSDSEVKELLSVIDLAMMFNCYTSGLRLPLDPQYKALVDG
ncbi:alkylhydroperoxidase family enzyme [Paucibacter oligotrophus]|uniref:Alkylhydroperoxidase family enzyme n=1 Tax=Roseateles oligotrophus TaxID=1769250 RepID=A0A840KZW9_9BURK|nr:carboxymuconolactone decarboxylase family protein [Roseateles oligotrophus]MBB4841724.1 alkylhydroperoxidase family enzyme [Roseateles oligotrophus]